MASPQAIIIAGASLASASASTFDASDMSMNGLAMIVGLATRYAAAAGALLVLNFWFAKGQGFLDGTNHDVVWLVIFIVLGLVPAGRIAGLDDGLSDKLPFLR